jgi:DNA-binding PadR family transcriptional regulator
MYLSEDAEPQRSSLEAFILALISQGVTTTYAFQTAAGLSLGATVPALKRLAEAGLVIKKIIGRRHEFTLTRDGKKALKTWDTEKMRSLRDLDEVVRATFLTSLLSRNKLAPAKVLRQAAKVRRRMAEEQNEEAERLRAELGSKFDLHAYQWMRALSEAARLTAEQAVLDKAAAAMERKRKP